MRLSKRIRLIEKSLKSRDIYFFRKDLKSFQELISKMQEANPRASILDCIQGYNDALKELILKTNTIRSAQIYRYIALESLLNSREYNTIVSKLNAKYDSDSKDIEFTGNLEKDYQALVKTFFYSEYILKHKDLKEYLKSAPNDKKLQAEIKEIEDQMNKILNGKLTVYDYNKIQNKEKRFKKND